MVVWRCTTCRSADSTRNGLMMNMRPLCCKTEVNTVQSTSQTEEIISQKVSMQAYKQSFNSQSRECASSLESWHMRKHFPHECLHVSEAAVIPLLQLPRPSLEVPLKKNSADLPRMEQGSPISHTAGLGVLFLSHHLSR